MPHRVLLREFDRLVFAAIDSDKNLAFPLPTKNCVRAFQDLGWAVEIKRHSKLGKRDKNLIPGCSHQMNANEDLPIYIYWSMETGMTLM
jgi:hypothetical protein